MRMRKWRKPSLMRSHGSFAQFRIWQKQGMPVDDDDESKELRDRGLQLGLDEPDLKGFFISRKNEFLGRWIRHGGFWPDPKMRLFRKGAARFEDRAVHEDAHLINGVSGELNGALVHHSYPTLADYIDHMNRYSSLGAAMVTAKGRVRFSAFNIVVRPLATFIYNYFFRLGFLDGREGLLLHLYHAVYVSWKYSKAWELGAQGRIEVATAAGRVSASLSLQLQNSQPRLATQPAILFFSTPGQNSIGREGLIQTKLSSFQLGSRR